VVGGHHVALVRVGNAALQIGNFRVGEFERIGIKGRYAPHRSARLRTFR